jgi:tetratricopeptide (TPR) repeat protein
MKNQLIVLFVLSIFPCWGYSQTVDCRFEQLFLSGNMVKWEQVVDSLQKTKLSEPDEEALLFAHYGLIGYLLGKDQKDKAEIRIAQFEKQLIKYLKREPNNANYLAFDAALVGFKIGVSPWKAIFLGEQSNKKIEKALKYRKDEILPLTEQANSLYFRPAIVGGDKKKAKALYEEVFRIHSSNPNCNWRYYSIGSWLGQVYTKLGETQKAREIYLSLLKKAPNFLYVKNELLPQLEQGKFIDHGGNFEKLLEKL